MENNRPEQQIPTVEKRQAPPPIPSPERIRAEAARREALLHTLEAFDKDPKSALELIAAQKYTSSEQGLEQVRRLMYEKTNAKINGLKKALETSIGTSQEETRTQLVETMKHLELLTKILPEENHEWSDLTKHYKDVLALKSKSKTDASKIFSEVFDEFNDFVESEIAERAIERQEKATGGVMIADVMQKAYGRTKEEIEDIKKRNRERVLKKINELKEKPYVTFEDIRSLHEINNRGIVPKSTSRMRKINEDVTFGQRFGTIAEELPEELADFEKRIEELINKKAIAKVNGLQYEIGVAKLHNELLDMHPFGDRNGSTALLFIELMMAREGHEPSNSREPSYYKALGKALNFNPAALAVVGYEQYKIAHVPGYFEGEAVKRAKVKYEIVKKILMQRSGRK